MRDSGIVRLDDLTDADQERAGGKAFNCARLKRAGFNVPDALVVMAGAQDPGAAIHHPWFTAFLGDALFAVRSSGIGEDSAGDSFAGVHKTLLDVKPHDVARAITDCLESARAPQAIEYRRARKMPAGDIRMAVLVQAMVRPVAAGVAFTINPVTGDTHEIVINSSWGVGEALVSGQVDPDEFVMRKETGELIWSRLGEKADGNADAASLTPSQLRELADLLLRIEQQYGSPQDVEWCHDGAAFWIVQSRPITTATAAPSQIEWTRANVAEVLPDLTSPQALAAFEPMLNTAQRHYMGGLIAPESELGPMSKVFYGRLYFNVSQLRYVCRITGRAPADMLRSMGHSDAILPEDEIEHRPSIGQIISILPDIARLIVRHLGVAGIVRRQEAFVRESLGHLSSLDVAALSDQAIVAEVESWLAAAPKTMEAVFVLTGVMIHEVPIKKICSKVGFSYEQLVYPQMAVGARSVSTQQAFDLTALADIAQREPLAATVLADRDLTLSRMRQELQGTKFLAAFETFLRDYGHRGRFESDWALPRYTEDISALLSAIRAHLASGVTNQNEQTEQRLRQAAADAWAAFISRLSPWQKLVTLPRVRRGVARIKQYYIWREQVRSDMMKLLAVIRTWHLALAQRFVDRGWIDRRDDYFMLTAADIRPVVAGERDPAAFRTAIAGRHAELARFRAIRMPLLMRESELPRLIRTAGISTRAPADGDLTGHPVSTGTIEADVVVIRDPGDFDRMKKGAILVATATDPSWTPLFTLASGVIVEVGGVLSHASTIAREYGLPAVANVKDATRILRTGDRVRLDAVTGIIHRLA